MSRLISKCANCGCTPATPCVGCPPYDADTGDGKGIPPPTLVIHMQDWPVENDFVNGDWPVTLQGSLTSTTAGPAPRGTFAQTDQVCCWWSNALAPGDWDDADTADNGPRLDVFIGTSDPSRGDNFQTPAFKNNTTFASDGTFVLVDGGITFLDVPSPGINTRYAGYRYQLSAGVAVEVNELIVVGVRYTLPTDQSQFGGGGGILVDGYAGTNGIIGGVTDLVGNVYTRAAVKIEPDTGTVLDVWTAKNTVVDPSNIISLGLVYGAVAETSTGSGGAFVIVSQPTSIKTSVSTWTGTDAAVDVSVTNEVDGASSVTMSGFTTTQAKDLLLAFGAIDGTDTFTAPSGFTGFSTQDSLTGSYKVVSTTQSSISETITGTTSEAWCGALIALRAASTPLYITMMVNQSFYVWEFGTYSAWPAGIGFIPSTDIQPNVGGIINESGQVVGSDGRAYLKVASGCCPAPQAIPINSGNDLGTVDSDLPQSWAEGGLPDILIEDFNYGTCFITSPSCQSIGNSPCCPDGIRPTGMTVTFSNLKVTNNATSEVDDSFDGNISTTLPGETISTYTTIPSPPHWAAATLNGVVCGQFAGTTPALPGDQNLYVRGEYCVWHCCTALVKTSESSANLAPCAGGTSALVIIGRNATDASTAPTGPYYLSVIFAADVAIDPSGTIINCPHFDEPDGTLITPLWTFGTPFTFSSDPTSPGGFAPGSDTDATVSLCEGLDTDVTLIPNAAVTVHTDAGDDVFTLSGDCHITSTNGPAACNQPSTFDMVNCCTGVRQTISTSFLNLFGVGDLELGQTVRLNDGTCNTVAAATKEPDPSLNSLAITAIYDDCGDCFSECGCGVPIDAIKLTLPTLNFKFTFTTAEGDTSDTVCTWHQPSAIVSVPHGAGCGFLLTPGAGSTSGVPVSGGGFDDTSCGDLDLILNVGWLITDGVLNVNLVWKTLDNHSHLFVNDATFEVDYTATLPDGACDDTGDGFGADITFTMTSTGSTGVDSSITDGDDTTLVNVGSDNSSSPAYTIMGNLVIGDCDA